MFIGYARLVIPSKRMFGISSACTLTDSPTQSFRIGYRSFKILSNTRSSTHSSIAYGDDQNNKKRIAS